MIEFIRQQFSNVIQGLPFARRSFEIYPDCFANDRQKLAGGVVQAAIGRAGRGEWVIVGAQFASGFLELENALIASGTSFTVVPPTFSPDVLSGTRLMLGLTSSLQSLGGREFEMARNQSGDLPNRLNVMVFQRHPLRQNDDLFTASLKLIPMHVRVGFFLSLDDPLLQVGVPEGLIRILQQMGMSHHQLVSSRMLTRRVQVTQRRVAAVVSNPKPADNAQEWMDLNLPEPPPRKKKR